MIVYINYFSAYTFHIKPTSRILHQEISPTAIDSLLLEIYTKINQKKVSSHSLISGDTGIQLFNYIFLRNNLKTKTNFLNNSLEKIAENSISLFNPTFSTGFAGINWLFKILYSNEILSKEDYYLLCFRDAELEKASLEMLKNNNYDFLHGATGICYYLLYSPSTVSEEYYSAFFTSLDEILKKSKTKKIIPSYDYQTKALIPDQVNLGLAHGIPSILKLCIQCYKKNICKEKCKKLAYQIIDFFLNHTNVMGSQSYFSCFVSENIEEEKTSRLAWCYGDLGIGIILYQAGLAFLDIDLTSFSLQMLTHSTQRKSLESAEVVDAGFCHGTAGIAHIYNKMWHYTRKEIFKESCDQWIQKTIYFLDKEYNISIHATKKGRGNNNNNNNDFSLLEGLAGIGLALISYQTGDFDWDYCLMLNT